MYSASLILHTDCIIGSGDCAKCMSHCASSDGLTYLVVPCKKTTNVNKPIVCPQAQYNSMAQELS